MPHLSPNAMASDFSLKECFKESFIFRGYNGNLCKIHPNYYAVSKTDTLSYLCGGGTLGDHDLVLPIASTRCGDPDGEQWFEDITCSGTDKVEL